MALGLGAVIVLSPDSLIVRAVSVDDWVVLAWRGGLMSLGIALVWTATAHGDAVSRVRRVGATAVAAGGCWAGATVLFVFSIRRNDVASTLAIVGAGPLFAAVMGRLGLREPLPLRTWLASVGVLTGVAWIFAGSVGRGALAGNLAALGGSLSFAAFLTLLRHGRGSDMTPALIVGGGLTAAVALAAGGTHVPTASDLGLLMFLGLVILPVSLGLTMHAARLITAAEVSLLGRLETILGPLWVWLAIGEAPPSTVVMAGAVILAATGAHSFAALRAEPRT